MTEDKIAGWHHQLNGHEFEQAPGVGDEQESLVCCSPWGSELNWKSVFRFYFFFFACVCPVLTLICWEDYLFFCLCSFIKDPMTIYGSISRLSMLFHWCFLPILSPVQHCHDYWSLIVILKLGSVSSPTLFYLSIVLVILSHFSFHLNLRICLMICTKTFAGVLIEIALNI